MDKTKKKSQLTVATVQMDCNVGMRELNLAKAERLIEQAANQQAKLVLLPELMPGGYILDETIWNTAEPFDGATVTWMRNLSNRLGVYIGTTFLEARGQDFFNTFVLTNPEGEVAGKVSKNPPASFEAYFYKAGSEPHWFDTDIGRIGVGICFENALYARYAELHNAGIDLYLRPFAGASFQAKFPIRQKDVEMLNEALRSGTAETAKQMGIPVVMSNRVGNLITPLPSILPRQNINFPGYSAIADSDGLLLGQLSSHEEDVIIATVHLDGERKKETIAPNLHGRWTIAMPWTSAIWLITQWLGTRAYARNKIRANKASHIAGL